MQRTSHLRQSLARHVGRCSVAALVLASASSVAAGGKSVAAHPLVIAGADKRDVPTFQAIFKSELLRLGLELVDDLSVSRFLASEPHHSCAGNNVCLARLAASVKAPVVFVLIHPYGSKVQLSGKLMLTTGAIAKSFRNKESARKPNQTATSAVRQAFRTYLPALVPESLLGGPSPVAEAGAPELTPIAPAKPAERPPEVSSVPEVPADVKVTEPPRSKAETLPLPRPPLLTRKPPEAESPVSTIREQPPTGLTQRRVFGIGAASVGAALAIVGGIFELQANKSWSDFDAFYKGGLPSRDQVSQMKSVSDRARSQQTLGAVMLIGGGAMIAGGGYLYFFGNGDSGRSSVSAAVRASPQSVSLRVKFP